MTDNSADKPNQGAAYQMPLEMLIELLQATQASDQPVRFRVKVDRRVRNEPPPVPDRRER